MEIQHDRQQAKARGFQDQQFQALRLLSATGPGAYVRAMSDDIVDGIDPVSAVPSKSTSMPLLKMHTRQTRSPFTCYAAAT